MQAPSYAGSPPKLIAGAPGVDFLNTVEWRGDPGRTFERLTSFAELAIWCARVGLLDDAEARRLAAEAAQHPEAAARVVQAAIALREAAVALLHAPPSDSGPLDQFNRCLAGIRFELRLERIGKRLQSRTVPTDSTLGLPLSRIAQEMVAALTADPPGRIRACGNKRCGWHFIDTSRNRARRWCQMATCGNQAKARAHYARHRRTAEGA